MTNFIRLCGLICLSLPLQAYPQQFWLNSPDLQTETLPNKFSCKGENVSPALIWGDVPASTRAFYLIVSDPDAPGGEFIHWLVLNIPKATRNLAQGQSATNGITFGKNSWGNSRYEGPCPPTGSTHHYHFKLIAVDFSPALTAETNLTDFLAKEHSHVVGSAELIRTFTNR